MPSTPALDLARAARLFHALSDETRLGIVAMLRDGERCVCDLQEAFATGQSRLSYHLRVLKDAGLATDRREGRWAYYALVPDAFVEAHDVVRALAGGTFAGGAFAGDAVAPARPGAGRRLRGPGRCCG